MANIRSIKRRIKTAKNIAQTTKAMQLVAASRMKKAQQQALDNRPYAERLLRVTRGLLGRVDSLNNENLNKYFQINDRGQKTLLILITSDKGLAGALLSTFARKLIQFIRNENKTISDYDFIIYGKKGKDLIVRLGGNIVAQFNMGLTQPKFDMVPPVARMMTEGFKEEKYDRVLLLYTDFINTLSQLPRVMQILPLKAHTEETISDKSIAVKEYLFEPSPQAVLESLLPSYFENELYHALLESYASEQSARMTAMKNATDNASDVISELTLYYNKARQQVITSEIADIITATLAVE